MLLSPHIQKPIGPGINMNAVGGRKPWAKVVEEDLGRQREDFEKRKKGVADAH